MSVVDDRVSAAEFAEAIHRWATDCFVASSETRVLSREIDYAAGQVRELIEERRGVDLYRYDVVRPITAADGGWRFVLDEIGRGLGA